MKPKNRLFAALALACALSTCPATAADPVIGLIVKTDASPFFVAMKQAALAKARALGVEMRTFSGIYDGDTRTRIEAIETLADVVARARKAGAMVIALDTPFDPAGSVDATFATDNFRAG